MPPAPAASSFQPKLPGQVRPRESRATVKLKPVTGAIAAPQSSTPGATRPAPSSQTPRATPPRSSSIPPATTRPSTKPTAPGKPLPRTPTGSIATRTTDRVGNAALVARLNAIELDLRELKKAKPASGAEDPRVERLEKHIETLQGHVSSILGTRAIQLDETLEGVRAEIDDKTDAVTDLEGRLEAIDGRLDALEADDKEGFDILRDRLDDLAERTQRTTDELRAEVEKAVREVASIGDGLETLRTEREDAARALRDELDGARAREVERLDERLVELERALGEGRDAAARGLSEVGETLRDRLETLAADLVDAREALHVRVDELAESARADLQDAKDSLEARVDAVKEEPAETTTTDVRIGLVDEISKTFEGRVEEVLEHVDRRFADAPWKQTRAKIEILEQRVDEVVAELRERVAELSRGVDEDPEHGVRIDALRTQLQSVDARIEDLLGEEGDELQTLKQAVADRDAKLVRLSSRTRELEEQLQATRAETAVLRAELVKRDARLDALEARFGAAPTVPTGLPLEDVKGIGKKTAASLRDAGVPDMAALAALDDDALARASEKTGISEKRIRAWRKAARS